MKSTKARLILMMIILFILSSCAQKELADLPEPTPTQVIDLFIEDAGTLTDMDGTSYQALQIGEQIWMGKNLLTTHGPDGEPVDYFCYLDEEQNCQTYGRLYTWDAVMHGGSGEGAQGICPDGWHIPSMNEWEVLIDLLGGRAVAGGALKEPGDEHWMVTATGAGGKSKLDILPSGWFDFTLEYRGLGESCFLRSSSAPNSSYASIWMLESQSAGTKRGDLHPDDAIPLRCIKD